MDRIEEAKRLRREGMTYGEIGKRLGVSGTMGRVYVTGKSSANGRKPERENAPYICKARRPDYAQTCQRVMGHSGIHLSDEIGKLIWW